MQPPSHSQTTTPESIEATAAVWLSLRDRGMSESETSEFMRWLQETPRHAEVFAELDAVWKQFDGAAALRAAPVSAAAPTGEVNAELLSPRVRSRRPRRAAWFALAAAAAVALAYVGGRQFVRPEHTAETAVGAFQKLELADGSVVQLNTDSAVDVDFTANERRVRLVRGEAHFAVAKNPARPFIVQIGNVAVRAVGTAFNIRKRESAVEVLVTEGRVQVNHAASGVSLLGPAVADHPAPLLIEGERAVVPADASPQAVATTTVVTPVAPVDVDRALAWQERRLEFDGLQLSEVVAEFNRYNRTQLVIGDPRLAAKLLTGTFRADNYEPFVRLLEENFDVAAERSEQRIVLRRAP